MPGVARQRCQVHLQRNAGGSGLGLALVKHHIDAHDGRIDIDDRKGGGAVFALTLPVA